MQKRRFCKAKERKNYVHSKSKCKANFDDFTDKKIAMNDTEENKQKTKTETKFSNTKIRVLQKNIIILHLLIDSTQNPCEQLNIYFLLLICLISEKYS